MKDLIEMVSELKGCQFASMTYENEVKCKAAVKKQLGVITKLVELRNIQIGASYENAVNNHLENMQEIPDFKAFPLPFGEWVAGQENKLIEHKGQLYLRFYEVRNTVSKVTYNVNGVPATPNQIQLIEENLYASSSYSNRQAEHGLTEQEDQVEPRVIKVDNILILKTNKQEYAAA